MLETSIPAPPGARRILLVDDDELIAVSLAGHLKSGGFEVDTVRDRAKATWLLDHGSYDLVIADCFLTGEPMQAVRQLTRSLAEAEHGTIKVLLSAYISEELTDLARSGGIQHVWSKPLPVSQLSARIRELLGCGTSQTVDLGS